VNRVCALVIRKEEEDIRTFCGAERARDEDGEWYEFGHGFSLTDPTDPSNLSDQTDLVFPFFLLEVRV
jgi:hypothetical protein